MSNKKNGKGKKLAIAFGCFFALYFILVLISQNTEKVESTKSQDQFTQLQEVTGATAEQEAAILEILNECGITKVQSIQSDELLDNMNEEGEKGYRLSANGINNIILYLKSDKTVNMIRYADNDLYANGAVVSKLSDYILTSEEQSRLLITCQNAVKSILKSPSTAKFPNITKWTFVKRDGQIIVRSYVDAQNSFGAELRNEFQFIFSADDYTMKSFIFDGEEIL